MNISFCHSTSARSKSECKWNYTSFLKTPSETMQNFSWNMKERILNVNMLYFISAIVKIWHSQKTKGMGFCICFEKTSFLLLSKSFLKENNVACMDSLSHHLESFLSQIQLLLFASGLLYPDRISDLRWSNNLGSKGSMIPATSPVWWNLWPPKTNQWKFWRCHSLWKRPFSYICFFKNHLTVEIWRLNDSGRRDIDSGKNIIITNKKCQGPKKSHYSITWDMLSSCFSVYTNCYCDSKIITFMQCRIVI